MNICACICMSVKGKWGFFWYLEFFMSVDVWTSFYAVLGFFLHRLRFFFHSPPTDTQKKILTSSINVPCHALFYLLLLLYSYYYTRIFLLVVIPHTDLIHSLSDWLTFYYYYCSLFFWKWGPCPSMSHCLFCYGFLYASCCKSIYTLNIGDDAVKCAYVDMFL